MKKEVMTKGIIDNLQQKDKKGKNKMGNLEEAIIESLEALIEEHEDEYHDCVSVKNMIEDAIGVHEEEEHGDFLYTKEEIDEKFQAVYDFIKGEEKTTKKTRVGYRWTENEDFELKYSLKEALNGFANVHKRSVLAIIMRIVDKDLLMEIEKEC